MIQMIAMLDQFVKNYVKRHRNRVNQLLHLVGVPVTFIFTAVFLFQRRWWLALGCFVGGYVLQWIGHAVEGNDAGEVVLVKKLLGKPYVQFAPEKGQGSRVKGQESTCDDEFKL